MTVGLQLFDTAVNSTNYLAGLKADGYVGGLRYDTRSTSQNWKQLHPTEAQAYHAKGLLLGVVYEQNINVSHWTAANGYADVMYSRHMAVGRGQPGGSAVYLAIDSDPAPSLLHDYFQGAKRAAEEVNPHLPVLRVGAYAAGIALDDLLNRKYIEFAWLPNAKGWRGYKAFLDSNRWHLLQSLPKHVAGIDIDPNRSNPLKKDVGLFEPFGDATPPPAENLEVGSPRWVQHMLNIQGAEPPLVEDGKVGKHTKLAIRLFQQKRGLHVDGIVGPATIHALQLPVLPAAKPRDEAAD